MTTRTQISSGQVLLAEPFMMDPYFRRAVVLLCEHHADGSIGFILNKTTDLHINDLHIDFPEFDAKIFYGGPVQTDTLHFVHTKGELLSESVLVAPGVWWGGDFEELKFMAKTGLIEQCDIRFFVGYAGWSGGQLHEEFEIGSWVSADMHANYAFKSPPDRLWRQVMYSKGKQFEIIADVPEDVIWN
jgi:putative transcriptional regulator